MTLLTKQDVMQAAKEVNHFIDESRRIYFKVMDYSENCVAPEDTAYRFYYWDIFGKRQKFTYYPKTVGFQSRR